MVPDAESSFEGMAWPRDYVLSGEFIFRAGGEGIERMCNELLLHIQTVLERIEMFFDEIGNVRISRKSPDTMKELMAKYGMEMLGPPILCFFLDAATRAQ